MNIWSALSLGVIFSTLILQLINFSAFHDRGENGTRITLMVKEVAFVGHALMVWEVTELVRSHYPWWFGQVFGLMFFIGVSCWFFVWLKGINFGR